MRNIAVVLPSHKQYLTDSFMLSWKSLFEKHNVEFILVDDEGDTPQLYHNGEKKEIQNELVANKCAGVRQLGFLYIAKYLPEVEYIITLDHDTSPIGDPIQDHIDALNMRVPISWISTATDYMRGFPYQVREEAPVMLSHGVWEGNYDWDAPSQLHKKDKKVSLYKGIIPKNIFFPCCGMNLGFRREALPYIFFAPVGKFKGAERFDDIYMGIMLTKKFAELDWGIVSGYAIVQHLRASNVFQSLEKEAVGIRHNEEFWKDPKNYKGDPWFDEFREKTTKWYELTSSNILKDVKNNWDRQAEELIK